MAHGGFKDFPRRAASDRVLHNYKYFDKKSSIEGT